MPKWSGQPGIISGRRGLPCRFPNGCDEDPFIPKNDTLAALKEAATRRNEHEKDEHEYLHATQPATQIEPFTSPIRITGWPKDDAPD